MQDWSRSGAERTTESEAGRDPAVTAPDRPEPPPATDDSTDWDELTPVTTGQVTPPADVLVAGTPLTTGPAGPRGPEPGGPEVGEAESREADRSGQLSEGQLTGGPPRGAAPASPPGSAQGTATAPGTGRGGAVAPGTEPAHGGGGETIIDSAAADGFHARWRDVQFGFVDDPRGAVRQADEMADEVLGAFTDALSARKRSLEDRWRAPGDAPDTERLRLIVRAYREFVDRLLTT